VNLLNEDFWALNSRPGFFPDHNAAAQWLQDHRGDPYWLAHKLHWANRPCSFYDAWIIAREIHGYPPSTVEGIAEEVL